MRKIIEFFVSRNVFVNLLTVITLVVGGYYIINLNREAFPNIDFDIVTVSTILPGAAATEVEKLVTIPIEEELKSVTGIDKITSSSIESRSGIAMWLDPDEGDTRKIIDDIRSAIDRVDDLPEDSEKPLISEITSSRMPIVEIALSSKIIKNEPAVSEHRLRELARMLEKRFLDLDGVAQIARRGWRDREMIVELNPYALEKFYISSNQVIDALKQKNINLPGGKLKTQKEEIMVRTLGEFETAREIRKVFVRANDLGQFVRIQDVATVTDGFDDEVYLEKTIGLKSISLTVLKKEKSDVIKMVDNVLRVTEKFKKKYSRVIEVSKVNDISFFVRRRLRVLMNNSLMGIVLVVISLFFFLNWRIGIMVALGMVTALAGSFAYLGLTGATLNLISMFGLVMVVGMVVDDAIIVAENIYSHLEQGEGPFEAAVNGTKEVVAPVTATIVTSIAAFGPLMYMSGIMGKFVFFIPFTVIVTLIASLFESFFILPSHVYDISKDSSKATTAASKENGWFLKLRDNIYQPTLKWALSHRAITLLLMTILFIGSIAILVNFGKFKLFSGAIDTFQVKFEAPKGYSLKQTNEFAEIIEKEVEKLPKDELDTFTTRIGIVQKDINDPSTKRGTNYGQIAIYLTPEVTRERPSEVIIGEIREKVIWLLQKSKIRAKKKNYDPRLARKLLSLEFEKLQGGPPVGKPISVEIRGEDFKILRNIARDIKNRLTKIPYTRDITDDLGRGKNEIRVIVDEKKAIYAGVSVLSIASAIRTAFEGTVATSIRNANEEIEVRVRFPEKYRRSLKSLNNVYVNNPSGQLIPVTKLAKFKREIGIEYINHLDHDRVLRVNADVNEKKTTSDAVNRQLMKIIPKVESKYPGYTIRAGGEFEDTRKSLDSLKKAFGIAVLIIFLILASLFRSIIQPATVMLAIPFSFIGVIIAFVTHGEYFGFLAMMGIIGLSGVVINDSIVLVDFANKIRIKHPEKPIKEVALEAGKTRLRAVLLTTITTVLGLLPTAYGIGGLDPFLVPAALAFSWGLAFSTSLTLVIVPIFYTWADNISNFFQRLVGSKKS